MQDEPYKVVERDGLYYVVGDPPPAAGGPWKEKWQAFELAEKLNEQAAKSGH